MVGVTSILSDLGPGSGVSVTQSGRCSVIMSMMILEEHSTFLLTEILLILKILLAALRNAPHLSQLVIHGRDREPAKQSSISCIS